jgi:hypothetical protein
MNLMAEFGYSGTPLIKKLGIQTGIKVLLLHPPANYFEMIRMNISKQLVSDNETPGLIHLFAASNAVFIKEMKKVLRLCKKNTSVVVWVSWYKKSSGISSDLSENLIREFALQHGLVDIKVCAVSNEWSGLKLVVPVAKR